MPEIVPFEQWNRLRQRDMGPGRVYSDSPEGPPSPALYDFRYPMAEAPTPPPQGFQQPVMTQQVMDEMLAKIARSRIRDLMSMGVNPRVAMDSQAARMAQMAGQPTRPANMSELVRRLKFIQGM